MKSSTPGKRGRPRKAHADGAILAATLDLLADVGISGLRVEDVAARAGVGKSAIYRRYESKSSLVAAAIAALVSEISLPDTGSTRDDLLALMAEAVAVYNDPLRAGVMPSLVAAMRHEPQLASAIRDGFLTKRRAALRTVLERGVDRGDLRADLDTELALDVLGGPLFYRLLITGGPLDDALVEGVADLILRGFAPTPRAKERRR